MSGGEVAGIIVGCLVGFVLIIGISMVIVNRVTSSSSRVGAYQRAGADSNATFQNPAYDSGSSSANLFGGHSEA